MSWVAAVVQVGGLVAAPLVPGTIQALKARMQGRRGPSPLQPYRELRRLWSRSGVEPLGAGLPYRLAPPIVAACLILALAIVPVAGRSGPWGFGHDAFALVGLLALARVAVALAAWDTGSGFTLMGAARDQTLAVFGEALLALSLLLAALPAASTDLIAMSGVAAGTAIWSEPAHWCALLAFSLVVVAETGRQPVDNPDTHLELTMIHEGPLLEYAGRDLAYLQWAAAARHWLMLLLAAGLFLPHPTAFAAGLGVTVAAMVAGAAALAVLETAQAKMRILRVPSLLGLGCVVALAGVATWGAGGVL
jgi:formate hydrogenlyase subunit 4